MHNLKYRDRHYAPVPIFEILDREGCCTTTGHTVTDAAMAFIHLMRSCLRRRCLPWPVAMGIMVR